MKPFISGKRLGNCSRHYVGKRNEGRKRLFFFVHLMHNRNCTLLQLMVGRHENRLELDMKENTTSK